MRVTLDAHERAELDGAGLGDDADIVATQIDEHRVLADLLGIVEQVALHLKVFVGGAPAPARAREGAVGHDGVPVLVVSHAAEDLGA